MVKVAAILAGAAALVCLSPASAAVIYPDSANSGAYQENGQGGGGSTSAQTGPRFGYFVNTGNATYRTYSAVLSFVVDETFATAVNSGEDVAVFVLTTGTGQGSSVPPATVEFLDVTEGTFTYGASNFETLLAAGSSVGTIDPIGKSTLYGGTAESPSYVISNDDVGSLSAGQRIWIGITPPGFADTSNGWLEVSEANSGDAGTRLVTIPIPEPVGAMTLAALGGFAMLRRRSR